LKGCARDDPGECGVLPFLDALWLAENDGCDVETLHLGENIFHILARCGGVERRRALLFHPTERVFLSFRIGGRKFRGVGAHGSDAGKVSVYGVDVNIDDRRRLALGVLRESER